MNPPKTTLFAQALLDCLHGLAADLADDGQIRTVGLADKAERILSLYRDGLVKLQVPDYAFTSSFQISEVAPTNQVTAFVSLDPALDPKTASLQLTGGADAKRCDATSGDEPFVRLTLTEDVPHHLTVFGAAQEVLTETDLKVPAPVIFRSLPKTGAAQVTRSKAIVLAQMPTQVTVRTPERQFFGAGVAGSSAVRIKGLDRAAAPVRLDQHVQDSGGSVPCPLAPGRFRVTVDRPDAPSLVEAVVLGEGDEFRLDLAPIDTPHEWLGGAVAAGVVRLEEILVPPAAPGAAPEPAGTVVKPVEAGLILGRRTEVFICLTC